MKSKKANRVRRGGRRPLCNTEEWRKKRNARRRHLYKLYPERRRKINRKNRESYRASHEFDQNKALPPNKIAAVAQVRDVGGKPTRCLTVEEMGLALGGYHKVVMYRWINEGKFPDPVFKTTINYNEAGVYKLDQAQKLAVVFGKHQETCAQFRSSHRTVIKRLFEVME